MAGLASLGTELTEPVKLSCIEVFFIPKVAFWLEVFSSYGAAMTLVEGKIFRLAVLITMTSSLLCLLRADSRL